MIGTKHVQLVLAAALVLTSSTASAAPAVQDIAVDRPGSTPGSTTGSTPGSTQRSTPVATVRSSEQVPPQPVALPAAGASTTAAQLTPVPVTLSVSGIPARALTAYRAAASRLGAEAPGCRITWPLLAGIGFVESGHGSVHGGAVGVDGRVAPPILGPRLDGTGAFALIRDTDGGSLDGDAQLDRAVGPMQFIPSTWARHGADGDGDGRADPHDLDDAATAAARYLCFGSRRLDRPSGLIAAVFSYNHSYDYVRVVLTAAARYAGESPARWAVHLVPAPVVVPEPSASPSPEASGAAPSPSPEASGTAPATTPAPEAEVPAEPGPESSDPAAPTDPSLEPAEPSPEPPEPEPEPGQEPGPSPAPAPEPPPSAEPEPPTLGAAR